MTFKDYADAATSAGTRTRNSLYLLVVVLVASAGLIINTQVFRFAQGRMTQMELAAQCINHAEPAQLMDREKLLAESPRECVEPLKWAERMDLPLSIPPMSNKKHIKMDVDRLRTLYDQTLNIVHGNRAALRTIQLPIFGVTVDLEDLGLLSGVMFVALLTVCIVNMRSELAWLVAASDKANDSPDTRKEEMGYLRKIQVIGSTQKNNKTARNLPFFVFSLVTFSYAMIVWDEHVAPPNVPLLIGRGKAGFLSGTEVILALILCVLATLAMGYWALLTRVVSSKPMFGWCYKTWHLGKFSLSSSPRWQVFVDADAGDKFFLRRMVTEEVTPTGTGSLQETPPMGLP